MLKSDRSFHLNPNNQYTHRLVFVFVVLPGLGDFSASQSVAILAIAIVQKIGDNSCAPARAKIFVNVFEYPGANVGS